MLPLCHIPVDAAVSFEMSLLIKNGESAGLNDHRAPVFAGVTVLKARIGLAARDIAQELHRPPLDIRGVHEIPCPPSQDFRRIVSEEVTHLRTCIGISPVGVGFP